MNGAGYYARAVVESVVRRGPLTTARLILHELRFDAEHGTGTSGFVDVRALADVVGSHQADGRPSAPVNPLVFRRALAEAGCPPREGHFIDFGSGKGRALLLALEMGFARVQGVEFSASLVTAARRNLAGAWSGGVDVFHGDASAFAIPADANVFFLANPFGPAVLARVGANIRRSLIDHPRQAWIVYIVPVHARVLEAAGFLDVPTRHGAKLGYRIFRHGA